MDAVRLQDWVGRVETARDTITPTPLRALAATLDHADVDSRPGAALPPLAHWLYFLPLNRAGEIGADGHPKRGGFLPPVPQPRRMWAGSRFEFHEPLRVGDAVERRSLIESVTEKQGRNGPLVFVTVRHELRRDGRPPPALVEWHDIVYRAARRTDEAEPAPTAADTEAAFERTVVADEVLLFRFSALTFNGHRIHYDLRYVTEVEGYPGLVVHGPLIATLLLDLLRRERPAESVASFRFRALRPSFAPHPIVVRGRPEGDGRTVRLWASDHEGWLTMQADATLREHGPADAAAR